MARVLLTEHNEETRAISDPSKRERGAFLIGVFVGVVAMGIVWAIGS
jgi:hypothetical protein